MSSQSVPVSPEFAKDPRGWLLRRIETLMQPGVTLAERDRAFILRKRALHSQNPKRKVSPLLYEQICRVTKRSGVFPEMVKRSALRKLRHAEAAAEKAAEVPAKFRPGAPIPKPPPLRRPAPVERPETWDPSVAGGPCL